MLTSSASGSSSARICPPVTVASGSLEPSVTFASNSPAIWEARSTTARLCGSPAATVYSFGPPKPSRAGSSSTITTIASVMPVEIRNERSWMRSVNSRRATSRTALI
jgi:hypothetical protein